MKRQNIVMAAAALVIAVGAAAVFLYGDAQRRKTAMGEAAQPTPAPTVRAYPQVSPTPGSGTSQGVSGQPSTSPQTGAAGAAMNSGLPTTGPEVAVAVPAGMMGAMGWLYWRSRRR